MLVKRSIVEKWYQRDSWVYRQFSYLFKNPLWSKRIPSGFSVCPYFWLSLFSFFIFRPCVVAPVRYVFSPLIRGSGKPAKCLDTQANKILRKIRWIGDTDLSPGSAVFSFLTLFLMVVFLGAGLLVPGIKIVDLGKYLYAQYDGNNLGIFSYWSSISFAGLFGVIGLHKAFTKTECKTLYYMFVWLAVFIIGSFVFIPHDVFNGLSVIGLGLWMTLKFLGFVLGVFIAWASVNIFIGLKWLFLFRPIYFLPLPWWSYVVIFTLIGYIASYAFTAYDTRASETPAGILKFRNAWLGIFSRILYASDSFKNGDVFQNLFMDEDFIKACCVMRQSLYDSAFEIMFKEQLDILQNDYPRLKVGGWKAILENNGLYVWDWFSELNKQLEHVPKERIIFDTTKFMDALCEAIKDPTIRQELDHMAKYYRDNTKTAIRRREARLNSWHHKACLKATTAIASFVNNVGRGIGAILGNIVVFIAYMWMLAKAKKKGVCPYFQFTDHQTK